MGQGLERPSEKFWVLLLGAQCSMSRTVHPGQLQKEGSKASGFSVNGGREAKGELMRNMGFGVGQT